jgi:hypothetical protein
MPNEKMQPIEWIKWPTGALVVVGSLWPPKCRAKPVYVFHLMYTAAFLSFTPPNFSKIQQTYLCTITTNFSNIQ